MESEVTSFRIARSTKRRLSEAQSAKWILSFWHAVSRDCVDRLSAELSECGLGSEFSLRSSITSWKHVTEALPALAREFNVALCSHDIAAAYRVATKANDLGIAKDICDGAMLFFRYGRAAWTTSRAPKGVSEKYTSHLCEDVLFRKARALGGAFMQAFRQLLGLYARLTREDLRDPKSEVGHSALQKAVQRLTETVTLRVSDSEKNRLCAIGSVLFRTLDLSRSLRDPDKCERPGHGHGATAECSRTNQSAKEGFIRTVDAPYEGLFWEGVIRPPMEDLHAGCLETVDTPLASKVQLVPKDYRGPRVIAEEPTCHAFVQGMALSAIEKWLKRVPALRRAINLNDQSINASLALEASQKKHLATLDLSDASDTVRVAHVELLLRGCPEVRTDLMRLATRFISVDEVRYEITSFAPMGSRLCFPMESVMYVACLAASLWPMVMHDQAVTSRTIDEFIRRSKLRGYGDDLLVRNDLAPAAIMALEAWGFVPNRTKCCYKGFFRESCGTDAMYGELVTPLRPRELPGMGAYAEGIEPSIETITALANEFAGIHAKACLIDFAAYTYGICLPVVDDTSYPLESSVVHSSFLYLLGVPLRVHRRKGEQASVVFITRLRTKFVDADSERAYRDALLRERPSEEPSMGYATSEAKFIRHALRVRGCVPHVIRREVLRTLLESV